MPDSFFFPVYSGLISPEHRESIGPALWEFLWLISKTTKEIVEEDETWGIVLGGKPIKICEISTDLGGSERTAKRNIARLKEFGYIETKRAPYGEIYRVRNSKKFNKKRSAKNGTSEQRDVPHLSKRSAKSVISNKDIKDIKRKKEGERHMNDLQIENSSPKELIKNKYLKRRAYGFDLSPGDEQAIDRLVEDALPVEKVLEWIDEIFDEYKPKHRMDRIKHFKYLEVTILDKWVKEQQPDKRQRKDIDWENL
ncbi:hypothetical protein ASG66_18345 [Bacillus sp. Leaf406]|nr:hypothetical protein ASG66_18345 [Bacillus sp. Leaf406]